MKQQRFKRYQLNKKSSIQVNNRHPWIFSGNISSAAENFNDGEFIKLVDGKNQTLGYGIYSSSEKIAVRIFHFGESIRNRFFLKRLRELWKKKERLVDQTNAIRLLNGESDGIPGITVDLYGEVAVVQYYSAALYVLARLISFVLPSCLPEQFAKSILVRKATRTGQEIDIPDRWTRGQKQSTVVITEFGLNYHVDIEKGAKSGFFIDLRGSRRELLEHDFTGMRALNLFSHSGAFSIILQKQGIEEVVSVERSKESQKIHQRNIELNGLDPQRDQLVTEDVFEFLKNLPEQEKFDMIIIDPPCFASSHKQVPLALKKYQQLHELALKHLNPESIWLSCCCTQRVAKEDFLATVGKVNKELVGKGNTKVFKDLPEELDHKAIKTFPEGRYLKQVFFTNFKI